MPTNKKIEEPKKKLSPPVPVPLVEPVVPLAVDLPAKSPEAPPSRFDGPAVPTEPVPLPAKSKLTSAGKVRGEEWGYCIVDEKAIKPFYQKDANRIAEAVRMYHADAVGIVGGIEVEKIV
jgi:hypothetical protein